MKKIYLKTLITTLLLAVGSVYAQAQEPTYDPFKTYDFTKLNEAYTFSGTKKVNGVYCNIGNGKFEGLAIQGGDNWYGNGSGLYNGNSGGRMFAVLDMKKDYQVKITASTAGNLTLATTGVAELTSSEVSSSIDAATTYTYTMTNDGDLGCTFDRWKNIYKVELLQIHEDGCKDPEPKITTASGTQRKFTLSCKTLNATIYYSENELAIGDQGWIEYNNNAITTAATTIYAYAKTNDATSKVISFPTGAGTTIKLNTPTITKTNYADGNYTVSFYADQSTLSPAPSTFSYIYTIDNGEEQTGNDIQVKAGSTVSVYAKVEGYDNSDVAEITTAKRPENLKESWTQDYRNIIKSEDGTGAKGVILNKEPDFTVGETNFYNIIGYMATENKYISVNTNVGLNTSSYFFLRTNGNNSGILKNENRNNSNGYIGINNLTEGDVIIITTNACALIAETGVTFEEGMSTKSEYYFTATDTKASIFFPHGTYNYVYTITVKKPTVTISLPNEYNTYCAASSLDFTGNADVEAYTAKMNDSKTAVTLKKVEQVPEGAGVILKRVGENASATVNVIPSADALVDNQLVGATEAVTLETLLAANAYILVGQKFCKVAADATGELAKGKAYLAVPNNVKAATLSFSIGELTGVESIEAQNKADNTEIYNIQGIRVKQPAKGLYIINGKKYAF